MKKQLFTLAACCGMAFATQAQDAATGTTGNFKATGGDVTLEANLNLFNGASSNIGLSNNLNQIRLRYFLNDDVAIRLGFGFSSFSTDDSTAVGAIGANGFEESKTSTWSFSPGIEKHFAGTDRLSPYLGAELVFTGQSSTTEVTAKDYSSEVSGIDGSGSRDKSSFGLNAVAGADWYVTRRLYLGIEVGLGFTSKKDKDFESTETITSGGVSVTETEKGEGVKKDFDFGPNVRNSIRIGFAF